MKKIFNFRSSFIIVIFLCFLTACSLNKQSSNIVKQDSEDKYKNNPKKVALGKNLFFDPILSKTGTVSCASCHKPDHGFADTTMTSVGINDQLGDRNTPTVFGTSRLSLLFWDGRATSLEEQALGPIENPIEMGETIENVLKKLNANEKYKKLFDETYELMGSPITKELLANAIAEFERTLDSKDSDFDRFLAGNSMALSKSAQNGYKLFKDKAMCIECHKGPDFTDGEFHNIGLPQTNDVGRAKITFNDEDTRKFKTPTLREIAKTAPYFHTGEFETLEEVISFYNAGGGEDEFKDPLKQPLDLTIDEQTDLVNFLNSLTGRQEEIKAPNSEEKAKKKDIKAKKN